MSNNSCWHIEKILCMVVDITFKMLKGYDYIMMVVGLAKNGVDFTSAPDNI